MAILFNKEQNRYIELHLFSIGDPEWIAYKILGGKIIGDSKTEFFRLDREDLFFHDSYEKEIENFIIGLKNIKKICYTFQPKDEGEFFLNAEYKGGKINITFIFRVIDKYNETEFLDNKFYIETSEYLLNDFLMQLESEYHKVRMY